MPSRVRLVLWRFSQVSAAWTWASNDGVRGMGVYQATSVGVAAARGSTL